MSFKMAFARAKRGLREERRLYIVAVTSLSVAFLCLGSALLATANLDQAAERWGRSGRMTIYLEDSAQSQDVMQLQVVLEALPEVAAVEHLTAEQARETFLEQSDVSADLGSLPAEVFPASLEVQLAQGTTVQRVDALSQRVAQFRAVADIETYRGWFDRLEGLVAAGRAVAFGLAMLVGLCVIAVIGNTIRLAVARRRQEIEVMKLCGATDGFVRGPFVLEGTFQAVMAAGIALGILTAGFLFLRDDVDGTIAALTGVHTVFLSPAVWLSLLLGGALVGAVGSALSLRRYLAV